MQATGEWIYNQDDYGVHNIIFDIDTRYLIEVSYVDKINPEHPTLTIFTTGFIEDGEFFYTGKDNDDIIVRFAKINK